MIFIVALALLFAFAAIVMPNITENSRGHSIYDPEGNRKILYEKICQDMIKEDRNNQTCDTRDWSLQNFIHKYLDDAAPYTYHRRPEDWKVESLADMNIEIQKFIKHDFRERNKTKKSSSEFEQWTFNDFIEKYEPAAVWARVKEEQLAGHNDTQSSFMQALDSTDELLSLEIPHSTRRWWNNQWQVAQPPHKPSVENNDLDTILYFMRQDIYRTRDRMKAMQKLRNEYKTTAVYKMGYLFAKTDYACKIFASLAFKFFRACSMIRMSIYRETRLFLHFMDVAYSIERLIDRWFDIDILKDLLQSNDRLARKVILQDENLTSPDMVVAAFNEMFID